MIIYYIYFHPSGINIPFLKNRKDKTRGEDEGPRLSLATELRPITLESVSTPALDEADLSAPNKKCVRRTISEPVPQNHIENIKARRSLKKMRQGSGDH